MALLVLDSCKTAQERAQKHLGKAIALDPSIVQQRYKDSLRVVDSVRISDSVRIKDSIRVTTKDSTIIIPASDLAGSVGSPCDSAGNLRSFDYSLGSGAHRFRIWTENGSIRFSSKVDSLVSRISTQQTYIEHLRDSIHSLESSRDSTAVSSTSTAVTRQVTSYTTFQLVLMGLGLFVVGFVAGKLIPIRFGA